MIGTERYIGTARFDRSGGMQVLCVCVCALPIQPIGIQYVFIFLSRDYDRHGAILMHPLFFTTSKIIILYYCFDKDIFGGFDRRMDVLALLFADSIRKKDFRFSIEPTTVVSWYMLSTAYRIGIRRSTVFMHELSTVPVASRRRTYSAKQTSGRQGRRAGYGYRLFLRTGGYCFPRVVEVVDVGTNTKPTTNRKLATKKGHFFSSLCWKQ